MLCRLAERLRPRPTSASRAARRSRSRRRPQCPQVPRHHGPGTHRRQSSTPARTRGTPGRPRAKRRRARAAAAVAARRPRPARARATGTSEAGTRRPHRRRAPEWTRARAASTPSGPIRSRTPTQRSSGTTASGSGCRRSRRRCARLATEMQHVLEAVRGDERSPRALALEQCVRRNRRPVREALDIGGTNRTRSGDDRLLLPSRRRNLRRAQPTVGDEDSVGERAADVDAEERRHARRAASAVAFACASPAIVIIGFTPDAVGNAEPSHTTRFATSHDSPTGSTAPPSASGPFAPSPSRAPSVQHLVRRPAAHVGLGEKAADPSASALPDERPRVGRDDAACTRGLEHARGAREPARR